MLPQMLRFLLFEFDVMSRVQIVKKKNKIYAQKKQRKEESVSSVKFTFSSLGIIKVFSEHRTYIVSLRKKLQ